MLTYSAGFSTKMLMAKLAQMGNFCLAKSDAMWPMAQMATSSASLEYVIVIITNIQVIVIDGTKHNVIVIESNVIVS